MLVPKMKRAFSIKDARFFIFVDAWGRFARPQAIGYHLSLKTLLRNVDVGFGCSRSQFVERSRLELADAFLGNSHFFAYFLER